MAFLFSFPVCSPISDGLLFYPLFCGIGGNNNMGVGFMRVPKSLGDWNGRIKATVFRVVTYRCLYTQSVAIPV